MVVPKLSDDQKNVIAQWLIQRSSNRKLIRGVKNEAAEVFHVDLKIIFQIWKTTSAQQLQGIPVNVKSIRKGSVYANRKKIDAEKIKALSVLQRSSLRVMAENVGVSKSLIFSWVKRKYLLPHTNAVKPFLTPENKLTRLNWSLSQLASTIENGKVQFQNMFNTIHVDEKWFYLTKTKDRYYLMQWEISPHRVCKSKAHVHKIMFNCAVSRPIIDKEGNVIFDGKFGIFPFVTEESAQRNSKNRPKGTMEMHAITSVARPVMKNSLINEMVPVIKAKWPSCLSKHIFIQQDNAKPHIKGDDPDFMVVANSDGFTISLIQQPPNSPDTNVNDLGFFRAIQSLKDQKPASRLEELIHNVKEACADYPPIKLNRVFLTLQACYTEIMKMQGDNNYTIPHMGNGHLERLGELPEVLEVDEQLVRESLNFLNQGRKIEDMFYIIDSLVEELN